MKKVLLVATVQSHISQFHLPMVKMLKEKGYIVHVAARNNLDEKPGRNLKGVDMVYDIAFSRSPYNIENIKAYKKLKNLIENENYDIVHCNTPVGGILARLACVKRRKQGLTKVIYTAHGFHFYTGGSKLNWMLYYPIEKVFSYYTDALITITGEDYERAKIKFKAKKVYYVPGVGIDINKFINTNVNRGLKRLELGIPQEAVLLISIGELNENKNHKLILNALSKIENSNIKYIIAGNGPEKEKLEALIHKLGLAKNVQLLGYRSDINELLQISDIYCFPSKREGLSVSVMEAMVCKLPCIVSNIRGNVDLIDRNGGRLFFSTSEEEFINNLDNLIGNKELQRKMGKYNSDKVKKFHVDKIQEILESIYEDLM